MYRLKSSCQRPVVSCFVYLSLRFDSRLHRYWLGGQWQCSVVTVCGIFYISLSFNLTANWTMYEQCLNGDGWKISGKYKCAHQVSCVHHSWSELEISVGFFVQCEKKWNQGVKIRKNCILMTLRLRDILYTCNIICLIPATDLLHAASPSRSTCFSDL